MISDRIGGIVVIRRCCGGRVLVVSRRRWIWCVNIHTVVVVVVGCRGTVR